MKNLPPEVLHLIMNNIIDVSRDLTLRDLKSLRLCNKVICSVASVYAYRFVHILYDEESYAKMENIAQHELYNKYVQRIAIQPRNIHGPLLSKEEFEQWLKGQRNILNDPNDLLVSYNCGGRTSELASSVDLSSAVIDDHYKRYSSDHDKEKRFCPTAENLSESNIVRFPNLRALSPGRRWLPLKPVEKFTEDQIIRDWWKYYGHPWNYEMDQALKILTLANIYQSLFRKRLSTEALFSYIDTRTIRLPDPGDHALVQSLIPGFRRYWFSFNSRDEAAIGYLLTSGKCANFLGTMQKLDFLCCASGWYPNLGVPALSSLVSEYTWPFLSELMLESHYTPGQKLINLLVRHKATVRRLVLRDILLSQGNWYDVFQKLQGGSLQQIRVYHLGSKESTPGGHGSSQSVEGNEEETDEDIEAGYAAANPLRAFMEDIPVKLTKGHSLSYEPLEPSHPLYRFLILGQEWSPDMAEVLKKRRVDL